MSIKQIENLKLHISLQWASIIIMWFFIIMFIAIIPSHYVLKKNIIWHDEECINLSGNIIIVLEYNKNNRNNIIIDRYSLNYYTEEGFGMDYYIEEIEENGINTTFPTDYDEIDCPMTNEFSNKVCWKLKNKRVCKPAYLEIK